MPLRRPKEGEHTPPEGFGGTVLFRLLYLLKEKKKNPVANLVPNLQCVHVFVFTTFFSKDFLLSKSAL